MTMPTRRTGPIVGQVEHSIERLGHALVGGVGGQQRAVELLSELGRIIPQYTGDLEHHVMYRPGFEGKAYSQSVNTILAHTEAPGWNPSPRYLALYCVRQARCGGGHTDLLDSRRLVEMLDAEELRLFTENEIDFPGPDETQVRAQMLSGHNCRSVFRFSYNLLTSGEYDPPLGAAPEPETLPLGAAGVALAANVSELFTEHRARILIPDDGMLIWDNQRMLHARSQFADKGRHLVRYWVAD